LRFETEIQIKWSKNSVIVSKGEIDLAPILLIKTVNGPRETLTVSPINGQFFGWFNIASIMERADYKMQRQRDSSPPLPE
jgi:hypothetical protein